MTLLQAILIAVVQGVTELFPISSLGHAVLLPGLFHLNIDENSPVFLPFLVVLHIGTATALLIYFWRDWLGIATSIAGMGTPEERQVAWRLVGLIVLATIPAVILGFSFEHLFRMLFGQPAVAAAFLIVNGIVLFMGEHLRHRRGERQIEDMTWREALIIGLWQCAALIPGISRSGMTIVGGLLMRFQHREAAHFSFLIATPIIAGAAVLEVPKLIHAHMSINLIAWTAGLVAGVTAYLSVAFLMQYFRGHDFDVHALDPFAFYCGIFGSISLYMILFMI